LHENCTAEKLPLMKTSAARNLAAAILFWMAAYELNAAEALWKAGVARANITPTQPLWLAGYASRDQPADGKVMELWLKVLALEDGGGHRAIILTSDTLGIPQSIYQHTCAALKEKYNLNPHQIMLSASHTHCGPVLRGALYDMYPLDDKQRELIEKYSAELEAKIVETVGKSLEDLSPARLSAGQGVTGFAVNRRNNPEGSVSKLIAEGTLKGPVDHAVPVLAVSNSDGKLRALLFGYACHNTVMAFNKWSGDYAGFAQISLEKSHTNLTAMFFMGCGGDQNPLPRRQLELAERYGNMLAAAVEEVLLTPLPALSPELKTTMEMVPLRFGEAPTEAELAKMTDDKSASARQWARRMLGELKAGRPFIRTYLYPMQAWRLGKSQLLLTLGGEPVVDYALRFKRQFGSTTWVAGYCNDVMTYIPSLRVLKEGGYEGGGAMIPYGQPTFRWAEDVDELISTAADRLVAQVRDGK
jgi:hypothetical protein